MSDLLDDLIGTLSERRGELAGQLRAATALVAQLTDAYDRVTSALCELDPATAEAEPRAVAAQPEPDPGPPAAWVRYDAAWVAAMSAPIAERVLSSDERARATAAVAGELLDPVAIVELDEEEADERTIENHCDECAEYLSECVCGDGDDAERCEHCERFECVCRCHCGELIAECDGHPEPEPAPLTPAEFTAALVRPRPAGRGLANGKVLRCECGVEARNRSALGDHTLVEHERSPSKTELWPVDPA